MGVEHQSTSDIPTWFDPVDNLKVEDHDRFNINRSYRGILISNNPDLKEDVYTGKREVYLSIGYKYGTEYKPRIVKGTGELIHDSIPIEDNPFPAEIEWKKQVPGSYSSGKFVLSADEFNTAFGLSDNESNEEIKIRDVIIKQGNYLNICGISLLITPDIKEKISSLSSLLS